LLKVFISSESFPVAPLGAFIHRIISPANMMGFFFFLLLLLFVSI
jgi:hypothetical protein